MDKAILLGFFFSFIGKIDFSRSQACGGDLINKQGMVQSPNYQKSRRYAPNLYCVWNFHFGAYDQIRMMFRELKMENGGSCLKDYIKLHFADKPEQKVCGFRVPRNWFSGVGPANITFVSDSHASYRGFHLQFVVRDTACKSGPCQNGGTCENLEAGTAYQCVCVENFTGENCEIEKKPPPTTPSPTTLEAPKYCVSRPCQNGGSCREVHGGYECDCVDGWEGKNCHQDKDECASNPCQNEAICENLINEYKCQCAPGWIGVNCEEDVDECSSNPCQNGGTCENLNNKYSCLCANGWKGANCEKDIDECSSNPCLNGGICKNLLNEYACDCTSGWTGVDCEEDIDECSSNPCRNGGICNNLLNKYSCDCKRGWTGVNCEEDADDCFPNPCKNGGVCSDSFNDFQCSCKSPWTGKTCDVRENLKQEKEEEIDEDSEDPVSDDPCASEPCLHEGECIDLGDESVFCICQDGFSGDFCEEGSNVCIPNPCKNDGICVAWGESFTCTCAAGWEGDDCTKNIDECLSNPCAVDLACVDKVDSYVCRPECDHGYTGEECDIEINECYSDPCKNGAICKDELGYFSCKCVLGFKGILCDSYDVCAESPCRNGGTCHEDSTKNSTNVFLCTCQLGWMGQTCETVVENGCLNPDGSSYGLVPYGVSLEFYCGNGFLLSGPSIITCQDTGDFTNVVPECIADNASQSFGGGISEETLKSPMVLSMLVAASFVIFAIAGFLLYVFVFAPWNSGLNAAASC